MQLNMLSESRRLEKISKLGDSLEQLRGIIDFEIFRKPIKQALYRVPKGAGGRPSYDEVMMFKILVLQRMYNLSDDEMEYQLNDRMSFCRFVGLKLGDEIPDSKTIWLFRDNLSKSGVMEKLFLIFNNKLEEANLITRAGSIVDATFIEAPKQRNNREENKQLKENEIPEEWKEQPNKLRQKDVDAKWTIKNKETHYGYKNHVKSDSESKLIISYTVTPANVHDSQELPKLVDEKDKAIYADSAYAGETIFSQLPPNVENRIHEKGYRNKPLTEEQKLSNKCKTKIRCRSEHIFGFMENKFKGLTVRSIGLKRAKFNIGLTNMLYNMFRYIFLRNNPIFVG